MIHKVLYLLISPPAMKLKILLILLCLSIAFSACVHKTAPSPVISQGSYPPAIATIMVTKCAIAGCYNQASYCNADSLLLDSWEHLFKGDNSGAVVIPYSPAYSTLLYYVNTDPNHGIAYQPLMPYSTANRPLTALTTSEYDTLVDWIKNGAPDNNGNIAFASDPDTRQKSYLIHGDCDKIIAVIDSKTGLAMRIIPTGDELYGEAGHGIRFSPDGMYAYASLINCKYLEKIDARTDQIIAQLDLSNYTGRTNQLADIKVSPDGNKLLITDLTGFGYAILVNTQTMTVNTVWSSLINPHGVAANATFDTFFVTAQYGNAVYILFNGGSKAINIRDTGKTIIGQNIDNNLPNPHDIIMSPDYSKLFVTCQTQNRIQVFDAYTHTIIDSILVGGYPQDMSISLTHQYLFVTCMRDDAVGGGLGSVYVINYNTRQIVKVIYDQFYAPHGITVDDKDGLVYIASTNNGGVSHHLTYCGSPNGWYNAYDLNTLQPAMSNKRFDIFSFPYAMDTRFK